MGKTVSMAALLLLLLLVFSFLFMRRCRAVLFRRIAAFTVSETAGAAAKLETYLSRHHPAMDRSDLNALIPVLEGLLASRFSSMKIDPADNEASVFAVGSFIGNWVVTHLGGVWMDTTDSGPSVFVGSDDASVTLYPVQKAAMIQEFREPGELSAYLSSLAIIDRAVNNAGG